MQRRMDYAPEVNGNAPIAHYTDESRTFGGLVFPTRRCVLRRNPEGIANRSVAFITIDIHDITITPAMTGGDPS
jgi:hypothetical protein